MKAAIAAVKSDNNKEVIAIFGAGAKELIYSGDPIGDKQRRERFIQAFDKKNSLSKEGDKIFLVVGENDWPFPIPLVKKGDQWLFDTKAGKEEILNRRIGQNELFTIQTMLAIVDAQREYAMKDFDDDGILEYAEKFRSDAGKKNGLYWKTKDGEEPSPLGDLVAQARAEGYKQGGPKNNPVPYHGYYFRMLHKQGKHATGGAFDYVERISTRPAEGLCHGQGARKNKGRDRGGSECPDLVADCKMIPAPSMETALKLAASELGSSSRVLIVPHAMLTLPVIQEAN